MGQRGRAEAAARYLLERRAGAVREGAFPADFAPHDESEAYAIQTEVLHRLGARVGGWKASLASPSEGQSAPLYTAAIHHSPARLGRDTLPTRGTHAIGIEAEIAFRLQTALAPRPDGQPHERSAVLDAIGTAHPVIELCVCRFARFETAPALDKLADNLIHEALIVGPAHTDWRRLDMAQLPLELYIDGQAVHRGVGGHSLSDPLAPVVWLARHLNTRGLTLEAGQIVITGSCCGIHFVTGHARALAVFGDLGTVGVSFDPSRDP
jgi:2-keto-4-pentenoate hydratase